ncbi:hypothetical protein ARAM_006380 [Aspergillus rambellii]|uniref:Rhodopsin domain-containing protein n=2 Tax=Aspergillus subgen. Nidulantes TaxID=2720870 RepID=A0A0F8XIA1_9EURO|nr:hypothetical protein AOCH_005574 [Aspergillus ochraceoroseus]KKK23297.1 hypothetical protein ARAM_006380 [Aspergillus rambellii]
MQLPPAEVLASWPEPNYINPITRGHSVLIVSIVCSALATIVTGLRIFTRVKITCTAGMDDLLIILGLLFGIAMAAVISVASFYYGWDRHMWDVPLEWLPTVSKLNLTFQILFSLSASLTKLSFLWFCKRILGAGGKGLYQAYNLALIAAMNAVAVSSVLFMGLSLFQCHPIHAYWDLMPSSPYSCLDDGAIVFSASVINIFTDFVVTLIPMPLIWNLKLPTRQRIATMSIFALGLVVDVAGSVRTVYVWKSMIASYDTTWVGWPILLAATVEINIGLICASAPALRPLIAFFLPRLLGPSYQNDSSTGRRTRSMKQLRSSITISKPSRVRSRHYGLYEDLPMDRLEVFRTIEMNTYTEIRTSTQPVGNVYDICRNPPQYTPRRTHLSRHNSDMSIPYRYSTGDWSVTSLTSEIKGPLVRENEPG